MQKDLKEGLVSELKPNREGMINWPKTITFPQFPFITAYDDDDDAEEVEDVFIEDIVEKYLRKFATVSVQIRRLDCGIRMVSFTSGTKKQK